MFRSPFRLIAVCIVFLAMGCSALQIESTDGGRGVEDDTLDEATVAAGLKDALRVGTERTVISTSAVDGFWRNALIRIVMPEEFESTAKTLRSIGFGQQVDEFELAMNRAAELAAGEAKDVFWDAITQMTVVYAFAILGGGETAATDYFRAHTYDQLRARFRPIVQDKMSESGLYRVYNDLMSEFDALPIVSKPSFDLDAYITEKSLEGLFTVLAQEEKRIREDPFARTTELLRRVFKG